MSDACLDEEAVTALLEGRAEGAARAELLAHLSGCEDCRALVSAASALMSESSPPPTQLAPSGSRFSRYMIIDVVGTGSMGVVYAAYDPELDRRVAIKVLRRGGDGGDEARRALARREAQALARVQHPNVVSVYDVGVEADELFVVMEFLQGRTLRRWLGETPRSREEILRAFGAAGRGLAAAHAAGLVHRDFKPENVLVTPEGRVAVTDFGLAQWGVNAEHRSIVGTPAYMAPEQWEGHADARSDLFSFSVALWEALTGRHPFGLQGLPASTATGPAAAPELPAHLLRALRRGLAATPAERPAAMGELLDALEHRPLARTGRWIAGTLAVALGVAAFGWWSQREVRACEASALAAGEVWNDGVRDQIRGALADGGSGGDEVTTRLILAHVDDYVSGWAQARKQACVATRVLEEQPEEVYGARARCLDRQLADLAAVTRVLMVPNAKHTALASKAVWALPPTQRCADADALLAVVSPPRDPQQRRAVDDAFLELAELRALPYTERYKEGAERALTLQQRADALGYAPLLAQALTLRAQFFDLLGDFAGEEAALEQAMLAAERGRDRLTAARAMVELVWILGSQRGDPKGAIAIGEHAAAVLVGLGGDLELEAQLASNLAALKVDQGDLVGAQALYEAVVDKRRALFGPRHPQVAIPIVNTGVCLARRERLDEAAEAFHTALEIYGETVGKTHPLYLSTLCNLADLERQLGRNEAARARAEQALELVGVALGQEHPLIATAENVLGIIDVDARHFADARAHFERALAIAEQTRGPDHPYVAHYLAGLGDALQGLGDQAGAAEAYRRAAAIHERAENPLMRGHALIGLGSAQRALGQLAEARATLAVALALAEANDTGMWRGLARLEAAEACTRKERARARALAEAALADLLEAKDEPLVARARAFLATK